MRIKASPNHPVPLSSTPPSLPGNLALLHHSLASLMPFFPSPLDLINLQGLFYLPSFSQIRSLPSVSTTQFKKPSSLPCADPNGSTLSSLQPVLYTLPRTIASKCTSAPVAVILKALQRLLLAQAVIRSNIHQATLWSCLRQAFAHTVLSGSNVSPYSFV